MSLEDHLKIIKQKLTPQPKKKKEHKIIVKDDTIDLGFSSDSIGDIFCDIETQKEEQKLKQGL